MRRTRTKPLTSELVRVLVDARKAQGHSLSDVGYAFGQDYQTIWRWEHGKVRPTLDNFVRWADALGLDIHLQPR